LRDAIYYCFLRFGKLTEELPSNIKSLLPDSHWSDTYLLTRIEQCPEEEFWPYFMVDDDNCNPFHYFKEWCDFIVKSLDKVRSENESKKVKKRRKKRKVSLTPFPNITIEDVIGRRIDNNISIEYSTPRKHQSVWPIIHRTKRKS